MDAPPGTGGADWATVLNEDHDWSSQSNKLWLELVYVQETEGPGADQIAVMVISGHPDDYYNGDYFKADDWNGHPHYATGDRRAHLFYLEFGGDGFWQIDWREQDGTEDLYDGGFTYAEPHVEELAGDVYWTVEDEEWNETSFYLVFAHDYWPVEEAPDCWGGDAAYFEDCAAAADWEEQGDAWYYYYGSEGYYYWGDSDYYYWDSDYYGDWYYGSWDYWYYYGDGWSIYAAEGDQTSMMAA